MSCANDAKGPSRPARLTSFPFYRFEYSRFSNFYWKAPIPAAPPSPSFRRGETIFRAMSDRHAFVMAFDSGRRAGRVDGRPVHGGAI
jgi:hypothetical protein